MEAPRSAAEPVFDPAFGPIACVDVPALPLQILVKRRGEWRGEAVAVVERDAPHGTVLWVNERARRGGVLPGLRYSAALSICAELRAAEVGAEEIDRGIEGLVELLRGFSPEVEASRDEPGVLWVGLAGLERIHRSRIQWGRAVRAAAANAGYEAAVVAGFRRFSTYAVAKALHGARVVVFESAEEEDALARRVRLRRIACPPEVRVELEKLAVRSVGDLLKLPPESVLVRFGPELFRLHRLASGDLAPALASEPVRETHVARAELDFPASGAAAVLAVAEDLARPLLEHLGRREQGAKGLALRLDLEDGSRVEEAVQPSEPTLDLALLMRLLGLRLEHVVLARGVDGVEVELEPAPVGPDQLRLFARPGRDPEAASRAFASLRAAFGDDVVVHAKLHDAHLPEASFAWEKLERAIAPHVDPEAPAEPPLIRRLLAKPFRLPSRSRHEEDGWLLRGLAHGPVVRLHGPHLVSGGWWRSEVERDYHFAELGTGEVLWIFFDRRRRRWFLHGSIT